MTDAANASVLLNSDSLPNNDSTVTPPANDADKGAGADKVVDGGDKNATKDKTGDADKSSAGDKDKTGDADKGAADDKSKDKDDDKSKDKDADGDKDKKEGGQADSEGAPDAYQFEAPEGTELAPEGLAEFETLARADNLSNATAQKYVNLFGKQLKAALEQAGSASTKAWETETSEWPKQVVADKEIGGTPEEVSAKLLIAKSALEKYADKRMGELLVRFKLGDNPAFVAFCYRAGLPLQPDKSLHRGDAVTDNKGKRDADVLWPNGGNGAPEKAA